ncbi:MAG: DUF4142 domain-containing protein [Flavipsychrobacter sp.]
MKLLAIFLSVIVLATGCKSFCTNYSDQNVRNKTDDAFMITAAYYDLDALDMARLVIEKSSDTATISIANMVVSYYNVAHSELQQLAIGADALPDFPDNNEQAIKLQIAKLSGKAFDSAYIQYQSQALASIIEVFNNEIANGQFSFIKNYAVKYDPMLLQEQRQLTQPSNGTP